MNIILNALYTNRKVKSRSISAENFKGEKGKGGMATEGYMQGAAIDLRQKWKVSPSLHTRAQVEDFIRKSR